MRAQNILRVIAVVLWSAAIFEILGGAFVWREPLKQAGRQDGHLSYSFSLYRLAPPPKGPPYCDLLAVSKLSFAMPCDFRPPFIDLARTYF